MNRFLLVGLCCLLGVSLVLAVALPRPKRDITYLDLQPKANQKLKEGFHGGAAGNDLAELPKGEQKVGDVKFKIGEGLIQLAGQNYQAKPEKVEGIKVGQTFGKLYILHAVGFGYQTPDNTVVGKYIIHYKDKTKETIEIVQGKDVRDWWYYADSPGVTRGKVAWSGSNQATKANKGNIRLYLMTWKNPHPKKQVLTIDYLSTKTTLAAPFCVAMTVEGN